MNKAIIKLILIIFASLVVVYPLWISLTNMGWQFSSVFNLFPLFGLVAFTLLWLHSISGVFEPWLRKYIDFDRYVQVTSMMIFVCIVVHPLLLLINVGFNFVPIFSYGQLYIWLAIIGWLLLIAYDIGKILKKYDFWVRNWHIILIISTIGFLLTFFHSLGVGDDLQAGPLRTIWIFYGVTAILATIYTYGIKRHWEKQ